MTPLLKTTGWWVWSGENEGSSHSDCFGFRTGNRSLNDNSLKHNGRAFAVRSRNKSQSQRFKVAIVPKKPSNYNPASTSNVIKQDGVFEAYANGIVTDMNTELEWKVGPDRDMNWKEANSWVQNLVDGWRMPTTYELKGLYRERAGNRNMTPLLKTTGWCVWSQNVDSHSTADYFDFRYGQISNGNNTYSLYHFRAFAVRSRSDG